MYLRDLTEEEKQALHRTPGYLEWKAKIQEQAERRRSRMLALEEIISLDEIPIERLQEILDAEDFPIESIRKELTKSSPNREGKS